MALDPVVLRVPRVDNPQDAPPFVLVRVASAGRHPLDVDLIGTDQDAVFEVSLRHQPSSLGTKNSTVNQEDWEAILSFILLGGEPDPDRAAVTVDVEAIARIDGPLTITLQKSVQGIKSRLGTITIPENEGGVIDIFEWFGDFIISKEATAKELASQRAAVREKDTQVKKLEEKLAELGKLKNAHENDLLEKFSLLLNEKKLKIRDQQRLLASSSIDPAKLAVVENTRSGKAHSAGPSGKGKRKAESRVDTDDGESDGFEKMEVDDAPESEQDQPQTPQDESTADEASEDEAPIPPPTRSTRRVSPPQASSSTAPPPPKDAIVPPKRELPFQKKPAAKPAPVVDGSETESDDEL